MDINRPEKAPSILNKVSNSNSPLTLTFIPNVVSGICSFEERERGRRGQEMKRLIVLPKEIEGNSHREIDSHCHKNSVDVQPISSVILDFITALSPSLPSLLELTL